MLVVGATVGLRGGSGDGKGGGRRACGRSGIAHRIPPGCREPESSGPGARRNVAGFAEAKRQDPSPRFASPSRNVSAHRRASIARLSIGTRRGEHVKGLKTHVITSTRRTRSISESQVRCNGNERDGCGSRRAAGSGRIRPQNEAAALGHASTPSVRFGAGALEQVGQGV